MPLVAGISIFSLLRYLGREFLLIVGIDRFLSEVRALTNYVGNAVASVLVGHWTDGLDHERAKRVLAGDEPFDEVAFATGDPHGGSSTRSQLPASP